MSLVVLAVLTFMSTALGSTVGECLAKCRDELRRCRNDCKIVYCNPYKRYCLTHCTGATILCTTNCYGN